MDVRANMSSKSHLSMCRIKYLSDKIQLLGILLLLQCVGLELEAHRLKRETRCSVYMDPSWQFEDRQCPEGKRYHCYENESDEIVDSGCFHLKDCLKGSHPIVEGETIVCGFCPTGFYQPIDGLKSNEYTFSYCTSHTAPCNPEYGQSLCKAGTKDSDRSCTCNATLGYSPDTNSNTSECQCFTPNSACTGCQFTGCPVGSVKTKRGFCEPEQTTTQVVVTSTPKQTISPAGEDNSLSTGAIVAIIVSVLLAVAGLAVALYCCHRNNHLCWKKQKQSVDDLDAVGNVIFKNPPGGTVNVSVYKVGHLIASNGSPSVTIANGPAETARGHRSQPSSNPDLVAATSNAEARPCRPTAPPRSLGPESLRSNPSDLPGSPASLDNLKSPTANISDDTNETTPLVENQREDENAVSDGSILREESEETSLKAHNTDQDITETKCIALSEDRKNTSQENGSNARLHDAEEPKRLSPQKEHKKEKQRKQRPTKELA